MHPSAGLEIGIGAGDVIADKYRVDRVLGVGGMGVVVAAHHLQLQELVAIKVLLPEALADADALRRFEHEARAAFKIKSEHVTRIIDVGTLDNGAPFMVMEYLEGEDLAARLVRKGPLPIEEAIELLLQACEAIAEAHTLGIVHRDIKPANLFCVHGADRRPSIKVLDFGISKLTHGAKPGAPMGMTRTRAVIGSPYYMSPEQMQSPRTVDARTDIWSLGVVLYQLLSGEVPFDGETLPQVCVNVATRPAPSLRKVRPDVPAGLEMIVLRCLEKDRNRRFPTVSALATALSRFGSKRAQNSLDRIAGASRSGHDELDGAPTPRYDRSTDRPVTGPLPTWGGTAKSQSRARSVVGKASAAALVIGAAASTILLLQWWTHPDATPAVLITPPPTLEAREPALSQPNPSSIAAEPLASVTVGPALSAGTAPFEVGPRSSDLARVPQEIPRPSPGLPVVAASEGDDHAPAKAAPNQPAPNVAPPNQVAPSQAAPNPTTIVPTCVLNLNSIPAAKVLLDGTLLGFTPRTGVIATVGEHLVLFRWDGAEKHESVTCAKGQTKTVAVRLSETSPEDERLERNPYR